MGLFKRNGIFYARIKDNGRWIAKTLNTADRVVARERYRELERRTVVPAYRASAETSLHTAALEFLTSRKVKGCAAGTLHMYRVKLGHIERVFGSTLPLAQLDSTKVDRYIAQRLEEGACRNTIGKELTALRGLLKVAKRARKFPVELDEVLPVEWANEYEPRQTSLTVPQVQALLSVLAGPRTWTDSKGREYEREDAPERRANRAAMVAFMVATGARLGEAVRAERSQIDMDGGLVYFRITKTKKSGKSEKYVPITPLTRGLLVAVMRATEGRTVLFEPWTNIVRDLEIACKTAKVPRVTPNDLRRTHANWLRAAGVDLGCIADVLGHVDSRMVERVYGRLRPEQLRDRVLAAVEAEKVIQ